MTLTNTEKAKASDYLRQGKEYQQQGNIEQSLESYQKAIELDSKLIPALSKLADLYRSRQEYDQAFTYYLKILSLRPRDLIFFWAIVTVSAKYSQFLLKRNDIDKAIAVYKEFLSQKLPENAQTDLVCHNLGETILKLSMRQGKFSPAIAFFQEAIGNYQYKALSYYNLGNILVKQYKLDEAIACFEKAVEINPQFFLGFLSLGIILLRKGRRNQAFQCGLKIFWNQGYFKQPGFNNLNGINNYLNRLLSVNSNHKKLKEALQKAIKQVEISDSKPSLKATTYRNIGNLLRDRGDLSEASDLYQKSIYYGLQESKPEFVKYYWELGKCREPDFLILGFGKCGTTAFYDYLCQHPQILPAVAKEPFFLQYLVNNTKNFEEKNWSLLNSEKDFYTAHFAPRPEDGYFITGEASVTNYVPGAEKIISSWFPKIKLIALLREPVKRTISHYEQILGNQNCSLEEVISSELRELEASNNLAQTIAEKLKKGWKEHIAMSLYVYPLERWIKLFSREQILILTNEDLARYPAETMNQAFDFLGLPKCNSIEYSPRNVGSYPQVDANLLSHLSNFFQPHNQRLEELLGRKFNWDAW